MLTVPCFFDGVRGAVLLGRMHLTLSSGVGRKEYLYTDIRSVHTKNTDVFLLKIRVEDSENESHLSSFVCTFSSMHLRDLLKSLILNIIRPEEELRNHVLDHNTELQKMHSHVQTLLTKEQIIKLAESTSKLTGTFIEPDLYSQKQQPDIYLETANKKDQETALTILQALTQPLIDVFITMNCSVNQFINLLLASYFYDSRNKSNSLDRLLADKIRGFSTEMNWATRINTYSFMSVIEKGVDEEKPKEEVMLKELEQQFPVELAEEEEMVGILDLASFKSPGNAIIVPGKIDPKAAFEFSSRDFEMARELCRVAFSGNFPEELREFTENFRVIVEGKYGEEAISAVERLFPTFYQK